MASNRNFFQIRTCYIRQNVLIYITHILLNEVVCLCCIVFIRSCKWHRNYNDVKIVVQHILRTFLSQCVCDLEMLGEDYCTGMCWYVWCVHSVSMLNNETEIMHYCVTDIYLNELSICMLKKTSMCGLTNLLNGCSLYFVIFIRPNIKSNSVHVIMYDNLATK